LIAEVVSMSTARAVLGLGRAFHDALDLAELAAHFLHHRAGGTADGFHRHGAEQVGDQAADEQADDHLRVAEVEAGVMPRAFQRVRVVGKQHQRGEAGGADRVALGHRLGGVAHGVQRVGDVAHAAGQLGHLGDAAGVVGDRAVGVERDDDAGHAEHRGGGDRDAVQAGQRVGRRRMAAQTKSTGQAVDFMLTPMPAMMLVPWPVVEACAMC
jgi:hypothetical protein